MKPRKTPTRQREPRNRQTFRYAIDMLNNVPVQSLTHRDLTIEGYSRAAVQTYWRIPELKLGFDLGAQPWAFMGTPTWFVSHTHLDHIAALPVYIARRRMMKMEPPTIYLSEHALEPVQQMMHAFTRLDRGRLPCQLEVIEPGDEISVSRELVVTVCRVRHTIPALGFVVWERRHKLRPEYADLSGEQIRDLRKSGTDITEERRIARLAYTGDTAPRGLDENPDFFKAQVLITEVTFVDPDHRRDMIHKLGHIHLDDIIERRDQFQNELVVASHFSTRYHPNQIRHHVQQSLPDMLDGRLHLWI
jgi:ribonuclease Z